MSIANITEKTRLLNFHFDLVEGSNAACNKKVENRSTYELYVNFKVQFTE